MKVAFYTNRYPLAGELAEVIRLFYGEIDFLVNPDQPEGADVTIHQKITQIADGWVFTLQVDGQNYEQAQPFPPKSGEETAIVEKRFEKRYAKQQLYEALKAKTGMVLPWGSLTGIRPTRLVYEQMEKGYNIDQSLKIVEKTFDLQPDKARLLKNVVAFQQTMVSPKEKEASIYIGIPFCPTRCSYCTFSAGEIGDGKLTQPYIEALLWEMGEVKKIMEEQGLTLRTLYVGGGTPTSISPGQLKQLMQAIFTLYPNSQELTVEAGRPDTINEERLAILKSFGTGRISINPQTMNEKTLEIIGRRHSPQQTLAAYELAQKMGFDHINMDLIAGLPRETLADFAHTLDSILPLSPSSITVHSLALKRGSKLWEQREGIKSLQSTAEMIDLARETLEKQGYGPYYLYRQKYMSENQENVGYAKAGYGCQYNVDMMEETTHIFAMGAGGITKRIYPHQGRIERAPNVSNIEHYIARVGEMVERKKALWKER